MKQCFKCGNVKPLADFYKHKKMSDGHVNKCKECNKSDVKANRDLKSEYYKKYDAWRFKNDPRVIDRHKRYQSSEAGKVAMTAAKDKWITNNPEKRAAQVILCNAVRDGRVIKPLKCSKCDKFTTSRRLHAHHHDYTKPVDVTWLCAMCHSEEHKQ